MGQFAPASLDLYHDGAWVPHSTLPNVHPPGVMAYVALVWRVFGYSILSARLAMLAMAALGGLVGVFAGDSSGAWNRGRKAGLLPRSCS